MLDFLRKIVDHNRFTAIAAALCAVVATFTWGCVPQTESPLSGEKVGYDDLRAEAIGWRSRSQAEADEMSERFEAAFDDLDRQYAVRTNIKQFIDDNAGLVLGPYSGTVIGGLAALGIFADNRRKDRVILSKKDGATP